MACCYCCNVAFWTELNHNADEMANEKLWPVRTATRQLEVHEVGRRGRGASAVELQYVEANNA